jgi:hypothetical protein
VVDLDRRFDAALDGPRAQAPAPRAAREDDGHAVTSCRSAA